MKHTTAPVLSRRSFLTVAAGIAASSGSRGDAPGAAAAGVDASASRHAATRGAVVMASDVTSWPWVEHAARANLTTLALHGSPKDNAAFLASEPGQAFVRACTANKIAIEHEFHAANELLPRELFGKDPSLFRMNDAGERTPDANLCVSSPHALDLVCENAVRIAAETPPSTGRFYFWPDDGQPMCRCPRCRDLPDSDQTLLLENAILRSLKKDIPEATLAHLCYQRTLPAPTQVRPESGIFLEFAPIGRDSARRIGDTSIPEHAKLMECLTANLVVFGAASAQVLEYWLDVSRFSGWKRETLTAIPWNRDVYLDDLQTYAKAGIRHITAFACWIDGEYVKRFGEPPLADYGDGLLSLAKR